MQVILLEKVQNLGELGDKVNVKPGFGRNYLIPQGKATEATAANIEKFEARRAELEKAAADNLSKATARAEALVGKVVSIAAKVGEEGRLFGSVGSIDIIEAAKANGIELERNEIRLSTGPIRQTGQFEVPVYLHPDVEATITVDVIEE